MIRRPTISVLIPARNEAARLGACLASLAEQAPDELLLIDGGSRDETVAIAQAAGARVVRPPGGRAAQLNAGAAAARGEVLLYLHADCRLPAGALDQVRALLAARPEVVGGCFTMRLDDEARLLRTVALGGDLWCRWTRTLYGDRALFVRRATFAAVGGHRELAVMEEVDLGRRLARLGRVVVLDGPVISSARHFHQVGAWRLLLRILVAQTAFELGVSPAWIRRYYYGT